MRSVFCLGFFFFFGDTLETVLLLDSKETGEVESAPGRS